MKNKRFYLYPILLGIYPALTLLAQNVVEIQMLDSLRAMIVSLFFSMLLYLLFFSVIKDQHQPALFTALLLILFFSYGHLYFYFKENLVFGYDLSRIRYLVPLYLGILGLGSWMIWKFKAKLEMFSRSVSAFSIIILIFPIMQLGQYFLGQGQPTQFITEIQIDLPEDKILPDIYFIVLDGYSRADILLKYFDYDNSVFLQNLVDEGFYVAQCSQANYSWTLPSITATLNMIYLDNGSGQTEVGFSDDEMYSLLKNNQVREVLEGLGYSIIAFENGFNWLHWYDADIYYSPVGDEEGYLRLNLGLNGFELLMLETTAARIILDTNLIDNPNQAENFSELVSNPREIHRQQVNFVLETLPEIPLSVPGPKFVYAHIVSPHDPYIFGPDGEALLQDPENFNQAYIDQLHYLNGQIAQVVRKIKENSEGEAVIIIQSDHGAPIEWLEADQNAKLGILNIMYLPDVAVDEILYDAISPVNTFRLIFNQYFDAELEILPDTSIFGRQSPKVELPCAIFEINN